MLAGRYEIDAALGSGGMGLVYRALDRTLREVVALKVLRADLAGQEASRRRFVDELRLARRVRHPNVCGLHEYGEDGELQFIAMEYVEGIDLKRLIRERGPLPVPEACAAVMAIARGLQAIHDAGILHRDLKTANIMSDARGAIRLMDFGIAKEWDAGAGLTGTGMVVGTPEYMSPERVAAGPGTPAMDVYALGVIAFELFTGDVPFRAPNPATTLYLHMHEPPPLSGERAVRIPEAVRPVLARALAKTPSERYPSAAAMAEAVEHAQQAMAAAAPPARLMRASASPPVHREAPAGDTSRPLPPPAPLPRLRRPDPPAPPATSARGRSAAALVLLALGGTALALGVALFQRATTSGASPSAVPDVRASDEVAAPTAPLVVRRPRPSAPAGAASASTTASGTLVLRVVPFADVWVDGAPATAGRIPLAAGRHTIRLEHPDYQPFQRVVTVRPGAITELAIDLAEDGIRRR